MTAPKLPQAARQSLHLAYGQQLENLREAKRLQWHMTYLGIGALAALAGAYQLSRDHGIGNAVAVGQILAVLGGAVATVATVFVAKASLAMAEHRAGLRSIAEDLEKLDDFPASYLQTRLGIPEDYGRGLQSEPFFLQLALWIGAGVLTWLMCATLGLAVVVTILASASATIVDRACVHADVYWW